MQFSINSTKLLVSPSKLALILFILGGLISGCATAQPSTAEPPLTADAEDNTPAVQDLEVAPSQASGNKALDTFSSDQWDLCFSYPQGYNQLPYNDTVEIVGPAIPESDLRGLFWLEISASDDRTAEEIADKEIASFSGLSVGRGTVTLGGEEALVLDGMPGQDLVRKVYIVHQQMLYILTFSPTLTDNSAASEQMEKLYDAVTSTWSWSTCPMGG